MKKAKRSSPYEDKPDPMKDLEIGLESPDDDGVIDLEDIIEMPDSPIDEDEDLDLDVEIFDVDSDLEPKAAKASQDGKAQTRPPASEEDDLLQSFGDEPEEDDLLFQPAASGEAGKTVKVTPPEPEVFDDDAESLLAELLDKPAAPKTELPPERKVDSELRAVDAAKTAGKALSPVAEPDFELEAEPEVQRDVKLDAELAAELEAEPEAAISDESLAPAPAKEAAPLSASVPPPADLAQTAEELIGRLESRLLEHIRTTVESTLPDLVRSILNEEIEKLRQERK